MALRWGICSAGKISQDFVTVLSLLENHTVQAIAARSQKDAQLLADTVGAEASYEGYESLATDPNVDIVYIGSINTQHCHLCLMFLKAKKHVLCEKPLAMNAKEVNTILDMAKQSGCFFMEGIWSRFFPSHDKVRSLIADGEIGDVRSIVGDFCLDADGRERIQNKALGGGGIYDIGIYLLQLVTMVLGPHPILVQGIGALNDTGADEICSITLKYPGSKVVNLMICTSVYGNKEVTIFGTKGRIRLTEEFHTATKLELILSRGIGERQVFEFPLPHTDKNFNFNNAIGLQYEVEAVKQAIDEGKTEHPLVSWSESLAICEIMDKLRHDVGYYLDGEMDEMKA